PRDERGYPRETVLQESAIEAARAGHFRQAGEIAAKMTSDESSAWGVAASLRRMAVVRRAQMGDVAGAIKAAEKVSAPEDKVFSLVGVEAGNLSSDISWMIEEGIATIQLSNENKVGAMATALKALALLTDVDQKVRPYAAANLVRILARLDNLPAAR